MSKRAPSAFWDSSAVVPLLVQDSFTIRSRELLRQFPAIISWWSMPLEVHGALVRLRIRDLVEDCVDRFQIRSADALQLAAALIWCSEKPGNRPFVCFDRGLSAAARQCGFQVHS